MPDPIISDISPSRAPRVALHTLGCKLNFTETSTIARQFFERGFERSSIEDVSDVIVLNTCSVTENAEKECRQIIRRALRKSPNAFVAVVGCYAQLRAEEIASIEGVDAVFGATEKFDIFGHLQDFSKQTTAKVFARDIEDTDDFHIADSSDSGRTRAFLKVQDGCNYNCSFCTIPDARGASRSGDISAIVSRASELSKMHHEIILSGVNIGDFESDGNHLIELLWALEHSSDVTARIRISSIEPNLLSPEIIDLVAASEKFCPHFHIPLQSGSNRILKLMQRRYRSELYRERVEAIKSIMPDASIGVDVIVGFPGESESDFQNTISFLSDLDISYLHVFTYSERPGTKAAQLPGFVDVHERRSRNRRLRLISEKKKRAFYESQIGKELTVLIEPSDNECNPSEFSSGFSENYVRVSLTNKSNDFDNCLVTVRAEQVLGDDVLAKPIRIASVLKHSGAAEWSLPVLAS